MYHGVIAVTGPQLDSDGTGYTVTISRALQANHKQLSWPFLFINAVII